MDGAPGESWKLLLLGERVLPYVGTMTDNAARHALEGQRELAERLAVGLNLHGAGCGHRGVARLQNS